MIIQIRMLVAQTSNDLSCTYALDAHVSVYGFDDNAIEILYGCVRCISNTVMQCIWCLTFGHHSGLCLFVRYLGLADFFQSVNSIRCRCADHSALC